MASRRLAHRPRCVDGPPVHGPARDVFAARRSRGTLFAPTKVRSEGGRLTEHRLVFRVHALARMLQRDISIDDIHEIVETGETIEVYPEDRPYSSRLVLGWIGSRALHAVFADNAEAEEIIVVTVYVPDPALWNDGFRRRKPS